MKRALPYYIIFQGSKQRRLFWRLRFRCVACWLWLVVLAFRVDLRFFVGGLFGVLCWCDVSIGTTGRQLRAAAFLKWVAQHLRRRCGINATNHTPTQRHLKNQRSATMHETTYFMKRLIVSTSTLLSLADLTVTRK